MTQEAKLKKIIERAKENDWDNSKHLEWRVSKKGVAYTGDLATEGMVHFSPVFLFDKSFAKAIWGECTHEGAEFEKEMLGEEWQHHLQQAVISKNPIDYFYENMEGI